jgi:hypothetical protein
MLVMQTGYLFSVLVTLQYLIQVMLTSRGTGCIDQVSDTMPSVESSSSISDTPNLDILP